MGSNCIIAILWVFIIRGLNASGNRSYDFDLVESKIFARQAISAEMLKAAVDPGPLVKYGSFCRKLPIEIEGTENPESSPPPIKYVIYSIDETTPNTLHMVVETVDPNYRYDNLVVMAVNEDGVPTGHFHLLVCGRGAKRSGMWVLGTRCNKGKDPDRSIRRKHGNPHIMYVEKDPTTGQRLSEQSIFWSWIPGDLGKRPNLIQFRIAVVEHPKQTGRFGKGVKGKDKFWVIITYRIKFVEKWIFQVPLAAEGLADLDNPLSDDKDEPERCYENPLTVRTEGNFQLTESIEEIPMNEDYLSDLFPVWFNSPDAKKRKERLERMKEELRQEIKRKDLVKEVGHFMYPPFMGSAIRRTKNHKEIYNGCSVVKNCIGDNENCVELKNCHSLITYKNMKYDFQMENYVHFELQVRLDQSYGYAAMGLSKDQNMGDDSVVECFVDKSGALGVYSSWNFPNKTNVRTGSNCTNDTIPGENLKRCKVILRDNILACSFNLRNDLHLPDGVTLSSKEFDLEKNKFYLLRATGSQFVKGTSSLSWFKKSDRKSKGKVFGKKRITRDSHIPENRTGISGRGSSRDKGRLFSVIPGSGRISGIGKHKERYATDKKLGLQDLQEVDQTPPKLKYIKWHAAIMVVAFIGLIPNGVYAARYFKETWTAAMIFKISIWRLVHWSYMLAVMLLLLGDFCVLQTFDRQRMETENSSSTHRICGYLFYAAVFLVQPLLGILTSYLKGTFLYLVRLCHWGIGTLVKLFANILIGFSPLMIDSRIFIGIWVICFLDLLFNIIMHGVMTVLYHTEDMQVFRTRRHSHGRWNRAFNPLPMTKIHQAMPGERRRLLLFMLFQAGTAIFASLIIVPYAGYNRLYICKDEPLFLHRVICKNPSKTRQLL